MTKNSLSTVLFVSFLISLASISCYANESLPTLIIFSADWCPSCLKAKNDINNNLELSEAVKNYYVVTADFDVDKDLVEGYNIKSIPTFVIIRETNVSKKVGYNGPKDLLKFIK